MCDLDRCKVDMHVGLFMTTTIVDKTFKAKVINLNMKLLQKLNISNAEESRV